MHDQRNNDVLRRKIIMRFNGILFIAVSFRQIPPDPSEQEYLHSVHVRREPCLNGPWFYLPGIYMLHMKEFV